MKLYTRRQLVVSTVLGAVTTGALVFALALPLGARNGDRVVERTSAPVASSSPDLFIPAQDSGAFNDDERENIEIYELLNEAVVNITTETIALNWFFEPVPQEGGTGSGSIIDQEGYILTNYHVVEDAYKVFVTLADGMRFEGEVVGKDPENDLAIVKFDPEGHDLVTIQFGSSSDLKVGQKVLAIGNPFAFERTLTTGIISGLGRPVRASGSFIIRGMIQTDASINPGNSGGPLLNSAGKLIGVNTMIYSPSGGSVGIGFATPVDTALRVIPDLIEYGIVHRGWIDIVPVPLQTTLVRAAGLPVSAGILVSQVSPGSNAAKAGIRGGSRSSGLRYGRDIIYTDGDIIVAIDGESVESIADFFGALEQTTPGEEVTVKVVRNRREIEVNVVLSERPANLYGD
jgi:S1-C subfamily serine protease